MHVPAPHPHHPFLLRPAKILPRSAKISYTLGSRSAVFPPSMFVRWEPVRRAIILKKLSQLLGLRVQNRPSPIIICAGRTVLTLSDFCTSTSWGDDSRLSPPIKWPHKRNCVTNGGDRGDSDEIDTQTGKQSHDAISCQYTALLHAKNVLVPSYAAFCFLALSMSLRLVPSWTTVARA